MSCGSGADVCAVSPSALRSMSKRSSWESCESGASPLIIEEKERERTRRALARDNASRPTTRTKSRRLDARRTVRSRGSSATRGSTRSSLASSTRSVSAVTNSGRPRASRTDVACDAGARVTRPALRRRTLAASTWLLLPRRVIDGLPCARTGRSRYARPCAPSERRAQQRHMRSRPRAGVEGRCGGRSTSLEANPSWNATQGNPTLSSWSARFVDGAVSSAFGAHGSGSEQPVCRIDCCRMGWSARRATPMAVIAVVMVMACNDESRTAGTLLCGIQERRLRYRSPWSPGLVRRVVTIVRAAQKRKNGRLRLAAAGLLEPKGSPSRRPTRRPRSHRQTTDRAPPRAAPLGRVRRATSDAARRCRGAHGSRWCS